MVMVMYKLYNEKKQMIAVKRGGIEKVIQYWSCHSVNLIDDSVVSRLKIPTA